MDPRVLLGLGAAEEDPAVITAAYEKKRDEDGADQRRLREAFEMLMAWQDYGAPGPGTTLPESTLPETSLEPTPLPEPEPLSMEVAPEPEPIPEPEPEPEPEPILRREPEPELVVVRKPPPAPVGQLVEPLTAWERARGMPKGTARDTALRIAARAMADAMVGQPMLTGKWSDGMIEEFSGQPERLALIARDEDLLAELDAGLSAVAGRVLRHAFDERDFARLENVGRRIALASSESIGQQAFKGLHLWLAKCLALAHPPVASALARRAVEVGGSKIKVSRKLAMQLAAGTEIQDWPVPQRIIAARMLLDGTKTRDLGGDGRKVDARLKALPATSAMATLLFGDLPVLPQRKRPRPKKPRKSKRKPTSKAKSDLAFWIGVSVFIYFALQTCS